MRIIIYSSGKLLFVSVDKTNINSFFDCTCTNISRSNPCEIHLKKGKEISQGEWLNLKSLCFVSTLVTIREIITLLYFVTIPYLKYIIP